MKLVFDDPDLDGQLQRTVAKDSVGMANAGECLAIAANISPGDTSTWYPAFAGAAERLRTTANRAAGRGHRVSARECYLRACEYYRNAFFYERADLDNPKLLAAYTSHRACFRAALPLLEFPIEVVEVRFAEATLTGYFARPDGSGRSRPTVIMPGGYDGTAEEGYPTIVAGVQRGYNVFCFDGPGQGAVLYEQRIVMRPDWEIVLPPVVDQIAGAGPMRTPIASSSSAVALVATWRRARLATSIALQRWSSIPGSMTSAQLSTSGCPTNWFGNWKTILPRQTSPSRSCSATSGIGAYSCRAWPRTGRKRSGNI